MQGQPAGFAEAIVAILLCVGIFLVVLLIVQILFLMTLMRTMREVHERNREMQPGMAFLTLIPLFGTVWAILMVPKIARSLEREFESRGWSCSNEGFGQTAGSIWAWGGVANIVLSVLQNVLQFAGEPMIATILSVVGLPLGLAILVCWIMYWVQISQYGRRLREGGRGYRPGSLEEDYDDYSQPRRDHDEYDRYEGEGDRR